MRGLWGFAILCVGALALGQGGQGGGFGGGGRGGAPGGAAAAGGQGGRGGDFEEGEVSEHILTQGDKTSWPVQAKADEGILITVTSDVFDPAVELTDAKDNVIAQNDDVEPGNQTAKLITDFPAEGEYKIRVSNYRSSAGGRYRIAIKRFKLVRAKVGEMVRFDDEEIRYAKVSLEKGKWYSFGKDWWDTSGFEMDGVADLRDQMRTFQQAGAVYLAHVDGARYFAIDRDRLRATPDKAWAIYDVGVTAVPKRGEASAAANPGGFALFQYDLDQGEAVYVKNSGQEGRGFRYGGEETSAATIALGKWGRQAYLVAPKKTTMLQLARAKPGVRITAEREPMGVPLTDKASGKLALGEAMVYRVEGRAFEVEQILAKADQFDAEIAIYDHEGRQLLRADDSEGTNPRGRFAPRRSGALFVVVSSVGNGGGGAFTLERAKETPAELGLGTKVTPQGVTTYRIRATAGQVLQLTNANLALEAFDEEGTPLELPAAHLGDRMAMFVRAKKDGWIYVVGTASPGAWLRADLAP